MHLYIYRHICCICVCDLYEHVYHHLSYIHVYVIYHVSFIFMYHVSINHSISTSSSPMTSIPSLSEIPTWLTLEMWKPTKKTYKKKYNRKILYNFWHFRFFTQGTRAVSQRRMVTAPAVTRVVGVVQCTDLTRAPPWASGKICFRSAVADKMHRAPPGKAMKIIRFFGEGEF